MTGRKLRFEQRDSFSFDTSGVAFVAVRYQEISLV